MRRRGFGIIFLSSLASLTSCRTIPDTTATFAEGRVALASANFDYYILALDWHPQYCKSKAKVGECADSKGFTLHGLWPQFDKLHGTKDYPESCPGPVMTDQVARQFVGLYPGQSLLTHEWEKHGTCAGLSPSEYLNLARKVLGQIIIPEKYKGIKADEVFTVARLKADFESENTGQTPETQAINCTEAGRFLQTIYFCLEKDGLSPRVCSDAVVKRLANACKNHEFTITAPVSR